MLLFLKRQITLAHVSGIPVRVDYRWILVLLLMTSITAVSIEPLMQDLAGSIILGTAATLLFFASIFIHEYSHAVAAKMEGLSVVEIVLHPFGGLARFRHPPETARAEFRIAIAGPAASFVLSLFFVACIGVSSYVGTDILTLVLFLLALTNFLIAVFNLFPGYPLDGGRVLRAYLWKQGKDLNEATILTGRCGQGIAIGLIVLGLAFVVVRGEFFTGFWAVLVGFFLLDSASSIIKEVNSEENVRIETQMHLPTSVPPDLTIQRFIDEILPMHRRTAFPVAESDRFLGMLVLEDVRAIEADKWRATVIRKVMRPAAHQHFVHCDNSVADARVLIETNGIGAVAVVADDGRLVGFVHSASMRKRA
jgi:Zn-dependent protease